MEKIAVTRLSWLIVILPVVSGCVSTSTKVPLTAALTSVEDGLAAMYKERQIVNGPATGLYPTKVEVVLTVAASGNITGSGSVTGGPGLAVANPSFSLTGAYNSSRTNTITLDFANFIDNPRVTFPNTADTGSRNSRIAGSSGSPTDKVEKISNKQIAQWLKKGRGAHVFLEEDSTAAKLSPNPAKPKKSAKPKVSPPKTSTSSPPPKAAPGSPTSKSSPEPKSSTGGSGQPVSYNDILRALQKNQHNSNVLKSPEVKTTLMNVLGTTDPNKKVTPTEQQKQQIIDTTADKLQIQDKPKFQTEVNKIFQTGQ